MGRLHDCVQEVGEDQNRILGTDNNITTELRRCRDRAWDVIRRRRHEVLKVYVADDEATDLVILGKVTAELNNGRSVASDFAARLVLESAGTGRPMVKRYQVFVVSQYSIPRFPELPTATQTQNLSIEVELKFSTGHRTNDASDAGAVRRCILRVNEEDSSWLHCCT